MKINNLNSVVDQSVFVVCLLNGALRRSYCGKLIEINEPDNIILSRHTPGVSVIPIDCKSERILKVYSDEGYIVYDNEDEPEFQFQPKPEMTNEEALEEFQRIWS